MKYQFSEKEIQKAKSAIKLFKQKREMWLDTKKRAEISLEKSASKYYSAIKQQIKEAEQKINFYNSKIAEFEEVVNNKEIDI